MRILHFAFPFFVLWDLCVKFPLGISVSQFTLYLTHTHTHTPLTLWQFFVPRQDMQMSGALIARRVNSRGNTISLRFLCELFFLFSWLLQFFVAVFFFVPLPSAGMVLMLADIYFIFFVFDNLLFCKHWNVIFCISMPARCLNRTMKVDLHTETIARTRALLLLLLRL